MNALGIIDWSQRVEALCSVRSLEQEEEPNFKDILNFFESKKPLKISKPLNKIINYKFYKFYSGKFYYKFVIKTKMSNEKQIISGIFDPEINEKVSYQIADTFNEFFTNLKGD